LKGYPVERVRSGLDALHHFMVSIYQAGVETPEVFSPENTRPRQGASEAVFTALPRLLFALGLYGNPVDGSGEVILMVEPEDLAVFCARARIKDYEFFFKVFEKFGLVCSPNRPIQVAYFPDPDLVTALVVFARACRPLPNKETNPPPEFLRMDLRLLGISRKKIRQVPLEPEEAIRALSDEKEIAFLRELDAWARSAGYTALVRCTGVHKSEFIALYQQPKPKRALFGFHTESGRLHMHLNFNQMTRILPNIAQAPLPFRELYYQRCTCAECGSCQDGPHQIELDGVVRRLCGYSYMNLPDVPPEHYETIQFLLRAQDGILKEARC
jgi:hypothetical protein